MTSPIMTRIADRSQPWGGGPMTGWMTTTPEHARHILTNWNVNNRKVSEAVVAKYARDMAAGAWLTNGDALRFSVDGDLLDGQHRLHAVARSGVTQRFLVVWNLPREAQATMDDGRKRTMSNVLELRNQSHAKTTASIARRSLLWTKGVRHATGGALSPSKAEMLDFLAANPDLTYAAEVADQMRSGSARAVRCAESTLGLAYWLFSRVDADDAGEFFARLKDGVGLPEGSPILALRNRLSADGSTRVSTESPEVLAWFIKAWNAWRAGRSVRILRHKSNDVFPDPQ